MERFNLNTGKAEFDESDHGKLRVGMARFGSSLGATLLGGSLYELAARPERPAPTTTSPRNEEWLVVRDGSVTVRPSRGEEELVSRGDVVCFPVGPDGAHKLQQPRPTRLSAS